MNESTEAKCFETSRPPFETFLFESRLSFIRPDVHMCCRPTDQRSASAFENSGHSQREPETAGKSRSRSGRPRAMNDRSGFRSQSALRGARRQYRRQGIAPYSRSLCVRAGFGSHECCQWRGRSSLPWSAEASASRTQHAAARWRSPTRRPGAHTGACSYGLHGQCGSGTHSQRRIRLSAPATPVGLHEHRRTAPSRKVLPPIQWHALSSVKANTTETVEKRLLAKGLEA